MRKSKINTSEDSSGADFRRGFDQFRDIKVDEIKKTSPPAEEPQSESQSPEETIEEVQEVLLKETEEEEGAIETSPVLEEIDDSGLPKYDPFVTELVRITFKKPVTGSQLRTVR